MVTDALLAPILAVAEWFVGLLPVSSPDFCAVSAVTVWVARVDSLVPVAEPLTVMLGVLAGGVVFVLIRLVLLLWNLVWP